MSLPAQWKRQARDKNPLGLFVLVLVPLIAEQETLGIVEEARLAGKPLRSASHEYATSRSLPYQLEG